MKCIIGGADHNIELELDLNPSPDVKYIFGQVEGIQNVSIYRYQIKIKIGKAFNPSVVLERIQKTLRELYEGIEIIENLKDNAY